MTTPTPDRLAALEAALRLIAAFEGKTLIMMSDDPHERQAYSLGAHRAFAQASGIASDALAALGISAPETPTDMSPSNPPERGE